MKRKLVWCRNLAVLAIVATALSACSGDTFSRIFSGKAKTPLPGKQISVLNLEHELTPNPKIDDIKIRLPRPFDNKAWPDSGGYPNHAMYHLALAPNIKEAWEADAGEGRSRYGRVVAQPVIDNGRIFTLDASDVVTAFKTTNGDQLWQFDTQPKNTDTTTFGGGVAAAGNRVYVGTGYGQALALDAATGKVIWRVSVNAPVHGSPTVADGRVFVVTVQNQLYVLAASDGRLLWTQSGLPEPAELAGGSSPAVSGDVVVVPYSSGELFALRVENGRQLWSDDLAAAEPIGALSSLADIRGAPVIDRGRVFAVSHSGLMVSIDLRTGDRIWERDIAGVHAPWVAGDFIYVMTTNGELLCLMRADGRVRWARQLPQWQDPSEKSDAVFWSGPILAGNRLIVASSTGKAYSISPYTGEVLGQTDFPSGVFLDPVVADKTLYVLTEDAELVALR